MAHHKNTSNKSTICKSNKPLIALKNIILWQLHAGWRLVPTDHLWHSKSCTM